MLIPYGTDSPIYYWPFATIALIVVNVIVFPLQSVIPPLRVNELDAEWVQEMVPNAGPEDLGAALEQAGIEREIPGWYRLALWHGDGLQPVQWVTSFFIHGGILHLIGNMVFLWAFGLIVEGKVGPYVFVALYLGIGIAQNIVEQVLFLPFPTAPSLGASSAIYGIMMVALLWAPQDNLKCMLNFWYYIWLIEVPIFMFGLAYFLMDFSLALYDGFAMGTALLHVMGAVTGLVPGVVFLMLYWVDGEQRDLISMFRELVGAKPLTKPKSRKEIAREKLDRDLAKANRKHTIDRSWASMDTHLNAGNVKAAMELFRQMRKLDPRLQWNESMLLRLITELQHAENWENVEVYSNQYLENFEAKANQVRLNLARMLVLQQASPRKAIKTLQQLDPASLTEKQQQVMRQINDKAKQMIADGILEVGD